MSRIASIPESSLATGQNVVEAASHEVIPAENRDARGRLGGVDSIRALAACIVVFGHIGLFPDVAVLSSHSILHSLARISAFTWNGPASVIVFFVVSGLCIHLPFRGSRQLQPVPFLLRRMCRIGVPVLVAFLFSAFVLKNTSGLNNVVWSVVCEAIYYLLYPALLPLGRRFGWVTLICVSYVVSFALAFTHLRDLAAGNNGYDALGYSLTWLIGLPCWLLGVWLAENERRFRALPNGQIYLVRLAFFLLMVVLRIVKFHIHNPLASNCITLNLFALLACLWIGFEIAHYKQTKAPALFEWIGGWSYSLYHVHPLSTAILAVIGLGVLANSHAEIPHLLVLGLAFLFAYIFHLLFERPSHKLGIAISRRFSR